MENRVLNVVIPCRDRTYMTQKTIESIHKYSTVFNKINIYCFDNLSDLTSERLSHFQRMLKEGLITYYSYDTSESLTNCFGKVIGFQRWINMMIQRSFIRDHVRRTPITIKDSTGKHIQIPSPEEELPYYMLVDNDMLFGPGWDQYFVCAADASKECAYFVVKFPGGCPGSDKRFLEKHPVGNIFSPEKEIFEVAYDYIGGASGMWFMNRRMLQKHVWNEKDIASVYGRFKKHDSMSWNVINRKNHGARINYVLRVMPIKDKTLLIHLGGLVGSMCNSLAKHTFDADKQQFQIRDEDVKNMTIEELFDKYTLMGQSW